MKDLRELQVEKLGEWLVPMVGLSDWASKLTANMIIQLLEEIETDYHNRWEEMRLAEQYQEKGEGA